jgi:hypothetical protein
MKDSHEQIRHEQIWLLLPWLANGRLAAAERESAEEHLRHCEMCERELAQQRLLCGMLSEPDRVVYAPGPSFRKLMARIDGSGRQSISREKRQPARGLLSRLGQVALWRPPGLAWAASFLILFGLTGMVAATYYRWSDPVYRTHTSAETQAPNVLHIALDRSLTIAEVEELLKSNGARIVEGPGSTGVFGVVPVVRAQGQASTATLQQQRALAARLHGDPRVLWVQPLPDYEAPASPPAPSSRDR